MKKMIMVLILVLTITLSGCKSAADKLELEDFVDAYRSNEYEVDASFRPLFALVNATGAFQFWTDEDHTELIRVYEYESEKSFQESGYTEWYVSTNGRFALELTEDEKIIEIFNSVGTK